MTSELSSPEVTSDSRSAESAVIIEAPPGCDVVFVRGRLHIATGGRLELVEASAPVGGALARVVARAAAPARPAELVDIAVCGGVTVDVAADIVAEASTALLQGTSGSSSGLSVPSGWPLSLVRWWAVRRARHYLNYRAEGVIEKDASQMRARLLEEPEPALEVQVPHEVERISLPHPALREPTSVLDVLGHLLLWTSGQLRPATFLDVLSVQLRPVPSFGSRHPFDVVVDSPSEDWGELPVGRWAYVPSKHELAYLGPVVSGPGRGLRLTWTPCFERLWWRYRYAYAYEMAAYDLGHILATLRMVAARLGVQLVEDKYPASRDSGQFSDPWYSVHLGQTVTETATDRLADSPTGVTAPTNKEDANDLSHCGLPPGS